MEKEKFSFLDVLSGKAAVAAEKKASPNLFRTNNSQQSKTNKKQKINENAKTAITYFQEDFPEPRAGGGYDLDENELAFRFYALSSVTKSEEVAVEMVKTVPAVLSLRPELIKDNFVVFEGKWGFDKALGLIRRNPNILSVPTTGYGSAEKAGDETLYMSYVIAATRPVGKPLLAALFIALAKPAVVGILNSM